MNYYYIYYISISYLTPIKTNEEPQSYQTFVSKQLMYFSFYLCVIYKEYKCNSLFLIFNYSRTDLCYLVMFHM